MRFFTVGFLSLPPFVLGRPFWMEAGTALTLTDVVHVPKAGMELTGMKKSQGPLSVTRKNAARTLRRPPTDFIAGEREREKKIEKNERNNES